MRRNEYIKLIHTLKKNEFPDDDSRYMFMNERYGKDSLKKMSLDELKDMLDFLGFNSKRGNIKPKKSTNEQNKATQKQLNVITEIWSLCSRKKDEESLRKFCERIVARKCEIYELSRVEASKVILGLKKIKNNFYSKGREEKNLNKNAVKSTFGAKDLLKYAIIKPANNVNFKKG